MPRIIAVANHAGGVAKTTTTLNLGHALAEQEGPQLKVLLVDFDPQGNLTEGLGFNLEALPATVYDLVVDADPPLHTRDVIQHTSIPGLDLLPSRLDLAQAESHLFSEYNREHALSRILQPVLDDYDVILIDCQPSLGLLPTNALAAATEVIIPVASEPKSILGLKQFLHILERVRRKLNPRLQTTGILVTNHDARTLLARQMLEKLRDEYPNQIFPVVVPRSVRTQESSALGKSILSYQPASTVSGAYRALAQEIVKDAYATRF